MSPDLLQELISRLLLNQLLQRDPNLLVWITPAESHSRNSAWTAELDSRKCCLSKVRAKDGPSHTRRRWALGIRRSGKTETEEETVNSEKRFILASEFWLPNTIFIHCSNTPQLHYSISRTNLFAYPVHLDTCVEFLYPSS